MDPYKMRPLPRLGAAGGNLRERASASYLLSSASTCVSFPLMVADRGVGVCQPSVPVNRLSQPARKGEKNAMPNGKGKSNPSRNHAFYPGRKAGDLLCGAEVLARFARSATWREN